MKVITESYLRGHFRKEFPETFTVEAGQILTPSAAQVLADKKVKILREDPAAPDTAENGKHNADTMAREVEYTPVYKYVSARDGGRFDSKPEHYTQLSGNRLVPKDHPRILFRGKLDSFQSRVLLAQGRAHGGGSESLVKDLGDILNQARAIMRADVMDEPLVSDKVLGLTDPQLRERSHNPKKFFNCGHILPLHDMGLTLLGLNDLRSRVREVEVAAVTAFRHEFELEKPDIIQALNRMSSAIYIMMLKEKSGEYR